MFIVIIFLFSCCKVKVISAINFILEKNRERIVISILSKKIVILILSRIVQPYFELVHFVSKIKYF